MKVSATSIETNTAVMYDIASGRPKYPNWPPMKNKGRTGSRRNTVAYPMAARSSVRASTTIVPIGVTVPASRFSRNLAGDPLGTADRVVDDSAEGDGETGQHHRVQRRPANQQDADRTDHGDRERGDRDERGAPAIQAERQQEHQDGEGGDRRGAEVGGAGLDVVGRAVEPGVDGDVLQGRA